MVGGSKPVLFPVCIFLDRFAGRIEHFAGVQLAGVVDDFGGHVPTLLLYWALFFLVQQIRLLL